MCLVQVTHAGIEDQRDPGSVFIPNQWFQWKTYFCWWFLQVQIVCSSLRGEKRTMAFLIFYLNEAFSDTENRI